MRAFGSGSARAGTLLACLGVAGCGLFGASKAPPPVGLVAGRNDSETLTTPSGAGLDLPPELAGFTRVDASDDGRGGEVVAHYRIDGAPGPATATVRMRSVSGGGSILPFSGGGSGPATLRLSGAALDRTIAAMRASDPGLAVRARGDLYLLRFGVLQAGEQALLDDPSGPEGASTLRLQVFCCVSGHALYSFAFRAPPSVDTAPLAARFLRELPWSADPHASVPDID